MDPDEETPMRTWILCCVLFFAAAPESAQEAAPQPIERLEAENAVLRREVKDLRERVAALEEKVKALGAATAGAGTVGRLVKDDSLGDDKGADQLIRDYEM